MTVLCKIEKSVILHAKMLYCDPLLLRILDQNIQSPTNCLVLGYTPDSGQTANTYTSFRK